MSCLDLNIQLQEKPKKCMHSHIITDKVIFRGRFGEQLLRTFKTAIPSSTLFVKRNLLQAPTPRSGTSNLKNERETDVDTETILSRRGRI